jgi:uncharacterized 2Fe-2S/4Fe-4S cluster protein (DUF4445 family)
VRAAKVLMGTDRTARLDPELPRLRPDRRALIAPNGGSAQAAAEAALRAAAGDAAAAMRGGEPPDFYERPHQGRARALHAVGAAWAVCAWDDGAGGGPVVGVYIESVCGGRGICGRCQIQVTEASSPSHGITSAAPPPVTVSETEGRYVSKRGELEGRRLSCSATIQGDLVVDVPQDVAINRQIVRKRAETRVIERDPATSSAMWRWTSRIWKSRSATRTACSARSPGTGGSTVRASTSPCCRRCRNPARRRVEGHGAVHHERGGPVVVALWPGLHNFACGIAVDIGSTTIACHLSSLLSGRTLASAGAPNPQIRFGEDLMSRVSYVMMNPEGRPP